MLTRCRHWDARHEAGDPAKLTENLLTISHEEALLVSRKTSFPESWNQGTHLCLIDGPSLFVRIYLTPETAGADLENRRQEHAEWLKQFALLKNEALQGLDTQPKVQALLHSIEAHMQWEEAVLFPRLDQFLSTTRVTRELAYEHQGIRRWLPQLPDVLDGLKPVSTWTEDMRRKAWEKFSLDLIHLLEHHIEHEERGPYPLYERLQAKEGKGRIQVQ